MCSRYLSLCWNVCVIANKKTLAYRVKKKILIVHKVLHSPSWTEVASWTRWCILFFSKKLVFPYLHVKSEKSTLRHYFFCNSSSSIFYFEVILGLKCLSWANSFSYKQLSSSNAPHEKKKTLATRDMLITMRWSLLFMFQVHENFFMKLSLGMYSLILDANFTIYF